ncbi:MAG: class I SAM-dependent methyltransferase [Lachnospiraceae bacterium]|nr:class I SAM-dependent methyltransferase [Lachnospiraceae bacterium]
MHFIHKLADELMEKRGRDTLEILEIGAGTGRYSIALCEEGHSVTAAELSASNLGRLKKKKSGVKAMQRDARNLSGIKDESFDLVLLLGPLYHLHAFEDRQKALLEAKRVLRRDGYLLAAYCMNEYSILTYGFWKHHIKEALLSGQVDESFHTLADANELYSYVRLSDIDELKEAAGLERAFIFAADGAANYRRDQLRQLSEEEFELFLRYQLATCCLPELLGASAHTVDVLRRS